MRDQLGWCKNRGISGVGCQNRFNSLFSRDSLNNFSVVTLNERSYVIHQISSIYTQMHFSVDYATKPTRAGNFQAFFIFCFLAFNERKIDFLIELDS
jgi:hypothetical protein